MKKGIFLIKIIFIGIIQVAIMDFFKIFGAKPDLLLIAVVMTGLFFKPTWAISFAGFTGIFKDLFSTNIFGINTLLFPLWTFLTMKLSKRLSLENNFIRILLISIVVLLHNVATRLTFMFLGRHLVPLSVFLRIAFLESLYTAVLSPLIIKIIK